MADESKPKSFFVHDEGARKKKFVGSKQLGGPPGIILLMISTSFVPFYFWSSCAHYGCAITQPGIDIAMGKINLWQDALVHVPSLFTKDAFIYALGYILLQAILYIVLPGTHYKGQPTPTGNVLDYKINALRCYFATVLVIFLLYKPLGLITLSVLADNYANILAVLCLCGYLFSFLVYLKGVFFPTNTDRLLERGFVYDYFRGVELNPRLGQNFDVKLFSIGHVGMIAWPIVNMIFAMKQYDEVGYVTNSMILSNVLQLVYIVDFFWYEHWYLATLDIMLDHFGWMLCFGAYGWMYAMYTVPCWFLMHHPIDLPTEWVVGITALCAFGYYLFRASNNQRVQFRKDNGEKKIWGKMPEYIEAYYIGKDGEKKRSLLLCSGYWGLARHFNYVSDLIMCLTFGLPGGFTHFMPYYYLVYMTILLAQRSYRDDLRCRKKYGPHWDEYCRRVPYVFIPYII